MSVEQQDQLDEMLKSPGWLLFREHARKQWGPEGYGRKLKAAISANGAVLNPEVYGTVVYGIDVAATEINALLTWPETQAKKREVERSLAMPRGGA